MRQPPFGRSSGALLRVVLAAFLVVCTVARAPAAPAGTFAPYQIEAAYLLNFTRLVSWPAQTFPAETTPLVIGILGKDPFGPLIDDVVRGEKTGLHPLQVRRFSRAEDISDCQLLFVSRSESDRVAQICATLKNRHILTVSDIPDFARRGGIIELVQGTDRIRFRIARRVAEAEALEISAKLLRPAEIVSRFGRGPLYAFGWFPPGAADPVLSYFPRPSHGNCAAPGNRARTADPGVVLPNLALAADTL